MAHPTILVPMLFVASVPRSIEFYRHLGLVEGDNSYTPPGASETHWASMENGEARLMLSKAGEPVQAELQAIVLYFYSDNIDACRNDLVARGIAVGPMQYPFWAPGGEFRVVDPDGFVSMISHR
ncbi:MAG TPA: VOC family protein [Planctomycetota bacterium]|nr:VOC family protein [Planctomycetota bacterium]